MISHAAGNHLKQIPSTSTKWILISIFLIVTVELIVGAWMFIAKKLSVPNIDIPGVTVFSTPEKLPAFALIDHRQQTFDNSRLRGDWTFAVFGYTSCPDFCPTTLSEMARLFKRLDQSPDTASDTRFVFISVDPYRDTPGLLSSYVTHFRPDFLGVTGSPENLHQLTSQIGTNYEYVDGATDLPLRDVLHKPASDTYVVDHYSGLLLIDPQGRLVATLLPPFDTERTLKVYSELRNYYEGVL